VTRRSAGQEHGLAPASYKIRRLVAVGAAPPELVHYLSPAVRSGPLPLRGRQRRSKLLSVVIQQPPEPVRIPARILVVAGSNLLAEALASALERYGFASRHILPRESEIGRGIEWRPNLVLIDALSLDLISGTELTVQFCQAGLRVCVIDALGDGDRFNVWTDAGASTLIDKSVRFEELFITVNRLLRTTRMRKSAQKSPASRAWTRSAEEGRQDPQLQPFAVLTEREQSVLAELMEGHCAEEIARAAFVSISTVRSQIKAILQKLGVNSQLAAVALARRADWSLDWAPKHSPKPSTGRPNRAS
jgi:DNA-binding NarL/FixJ family response regulator